MRLRFIALPLWPSMADIYFDDFAPSNTIRDGRNKCREEVTSQCGRDDKMENRHAPFMKPPCHLSATWIELFTLRSALGDGAITSRVDDENAVNANEPSAPSDYRLGASTMSHRAGLVQKRRREQHSTRPIASKARFICATTCYALFGRIADGRNDGFHHRGDTRLWADDKLRVGERNDRNE